MFTGCYRTRELINLVQVYIIVGGRVPTEQKSPLQIQVHNIATHYRYTNSYIILQSYWLKAGSWQDPNLYVCAVTAANDPRMETVCRPRHVVCINSDLK